jgi:hypothetical protein
MREKHHGYVWKIEGAMITGTKFKARTRLGNFSQA